MKRCNNSFFGNTGFRQVISITCIILFFAANLRAQPHRLDGDFGSGWTNYTLTDNGVFRSVTIQALTTNTNAQFLFNNASGSYNPKWSGNGSDNHRTPGTISTTYYLTSGGTDHTVSITNSRYYTFNVGENSTSDNTMCVLETTYNPVGITSVSQSPSGSPVGGPVTVNITTSGTPASGENIYVRYTTDAWSSSNFILATGSGTSWSATIPAQPNGTNVNYYILSSPFTTPTLSHSNADWYTLRLNNNGGPNYSYLPVEFIQLDARRHGNTVQLTWQTATETNNLGFEIERSADTRRWDWIGWVDGHGTTLQPRDYQFSDDTPLSGVNYYRLRQIDFDGSHQFSKIVSVDMGYHIRNVSLLYNPVQSELLLTLPTEQEFPLAATIYDARGKVHLHETLYNNKMTINTLPPGSYFLSLIDVKGHVRQMKFIKIQ